ncbi:MAG: hypothetical protein IJU19_01880 [Bacteroidales bacterium]|nr:hypothetical protein [Bacteroidales bacterium]
MTLIADSGSTKTLWADAATADRFTTQGLNPHFCDDEQLKEAMQQAKRHFDGKADSVEIHFYGAGCGQDNQKARIALALQEVFTPTSLEVATDILGACRAMCGNTAGVVGILGTGSNCCHYDGTAIDHQPFSAGYILGDHGSANHVGRRLLSDYLSQCMPASLAKLFHAYMPLSHEQIMNAVYELPHANRYLASLAPFALQHSDSDYCFQLVLDCLEEWREHQLAQCIAKSGSNSFCLIGGFGNAITRPMRCFLERNSLQLTRKAAAPIEGLIAYHTHK